MPATIDIHGIEATVTDGVWSCPQPSIQRLLQAMRDPDGPSGADPNPDLTLAREAAEGLGGTVTELQQSEQPPSKPRNGQKGT